VSLPERPEEQVAVGREVVLTVVEILTVVEVLVESVAVGIASTGWRSGIEMNPFGISRNSSYLTLPLLLPLSIALPSPSAVRPVSGSSTSPLGPVLSPQKFERASMSSESLFFTPALVPRRLLNRTVTLLAFALFSMSTPLAMHCRCR
jgi:hypothetical protein